VARRGRTKNHISFRGFLSEEIRVVEATEHDADVWVGLLDDVRFVLRADESRVLVVRMLFVQSKEGIAGDVAGDTGARADMSVSAVLMVGVVPTGLHEDLGSHVDLMISIVYS